MASFASKSSRLITVKTDGTDFFDYGDVTLPPEIVDDSDLFVVNIFSGKASGDGVVVISQWLLTDPQGAEGVLVSLTRPSTAVLDPRSAKFSLPNDPAWWGGGFTAQPYPRWNWNV